MKVIAAVAILALALVVFGFEKDARINGSGPEYTSDGKLQFPEKYRDWVFLSSGFDMSYSTEAGARDQHQFDNVFVDPVAFQAFQRSGMWPDKTEMVLEVRADNSKGSINRSGHFQERVNAVEVHVKDVHRFQGKWAFFGFDQEKTATRIPLTADCYSCHAAHGAVDTTFVQFYPTLVPVAKAKGTMKAE